VLKASRSRRCFGVASHPRVLLVVGRAPSGLRLLFKSMIRRISYPRRLKSRTLVSFNFVPQGDLSSSLVLCSAGPRLDVYTRNLSLYSIRYTFLSFPYILSFVLF
jgi:hypothetical protein